MNASRPTPPRLAALLRGSASLVQSLGIVVPLVVLWIVLAVTTPRFISPINLGNLSVQFAVIGALAIGTTCVIICREIDPSIVRTKLVALTISGASAGLAGVLVSARLDAANPTLGALDLLDAIAAVVIGGAALTGGTGSILGTAAGVLLIVTIRNGINLLGVNPFWQQTAIGSIIIIAAVIDHFNRTRRSKT